MAFKLITNQELSNMINMIKSLCHDLRYLIEMGRAVTSGHLDQCWTDKQRGTCAEIRWTNPQSHIIRCHMSSENPSFALRHLVNYIIMVYIPTVLSVRMEDNIVAASKHFLKNVILVDKYCLEEVKTVIQPILPFNAYMAQPENVVLSMVGFEKQEERKRGVKEIKRIRKLKVSRPRGKKKVRKFQCPELNFKATSLENLSLEFPKNKLKPPLTKALTTEELEALVYMPFSRSLPCTTTSVERAVQVNIWRGKSLAASIAWYGVSIVCVVGDYLFRQPNNRLWCWRIQSSGTAKYLTRLWVVKETRKRM